MPKPPVEKSEVVEPKSSPAPVEKLEQEIPASIEVMALRPGFFKGERKKEGDEFMVDTMKEVGSWMRCSDKKYQDQHENQMAEKKAKRMALIEKEKYKRDN